MAKKRLKPSQRLILIQVAAIIAAAGYWNLGSHHGEQYLDQPDPEQTIDFFSSNSLTTQFNPEGRLQHILHADLVEHIEQTDITLLTRPVLELYRGEELPWYISGERGELSPGGEVLDLRDNVRVEHTDRQQRPVLLTTSQMYYVFAEDLAHTAEDVRIDSQQGVTTATGMRTYLEQGLMQLNSKVRGRYETQ